MSDLLATLAAAGAVEAQGGFSIDPEKAREKLRQYQLAEPQRYVLLLVEAAVAGGASRLEFEIDSDDVWLRFDGPGFVRTQLESIYSSLFASIGATSEQEQRSQRSLRQLAFAVNSAMALNPRFVEIVSQAAAGETTRLVLRPDAPDELEQVPADPSGSSGLTNRIHVKDRFRPGLIIEFFRSIRGNLIEINLLREHCRWSRTPISINGEPISGPMEFAGAQWTEIDVLDPPDAGPRIGAAALGLRDADDRRVEAHASLLSHGVYLERVTIPGAVHGFGAIIDSPRFGKDVSQTKLLRDVGFDAVIVALLAAQAQMIRRLAERCVAGEVPHEGPDMLIEWLALTKFDGLRKAMSNPCFAAVAEVLLWPCVGGATLSTRALIEAGKPIRFTTERFAFAPIELPFVLALVDDVNRARRGVLERLFGDRHLLDATEPLRRELERERARLEFLSRKHPPELGHAHFPIRAEVRGEGIRGELGIQVIGPRVGWIRLIHAGCLLQELPLAHPLAGLCVVVEAELEPTADFQRAELGPSLAATLVAVLESLHRALTELARSGVVTPESSELRGLMRGFIAEVVEPSYAHEFLVQLGFSRGAATRELPRASSWAPDWAFEDPDRRHPIAQLPLFSRVHGGPCSLAELAAIRATGARIRWLDAGTGALPPLDSDVLLLEPIDQASLRAIFGNDALEAYAERLTWIRRRDAFFDHPTEPLQLSEPTVVRAPIQADGLRGEIGLCEFGPDEVGNGQTTIDTFHQQRSLDEIDLELPLPGLIAWIEADERTINERFDGLVEPMALRAPLLAGLIALAELELARAGDRQLQRCEWWWLLMIPNLVFGNGGLGAAFVELFAKRGLAAALVELDGLIELLERSPAPDLDRALGRVRGRDELPLIASVADQLSRPSRRPTGPEREFSRFRRALLPTLKRVLELPSLRQFTGTRLDANSPRSLTLADLYARVGAGEPISWVVEDYRIAAMPSVDFAIVGLDPIENRLLGAQLGAEALELVDEWLEGRAKFERRRTISAIQVPRGSVLTTLQVSGPGWRGELGIVRDPPRHVQRSKIRLIMREREATVLDLPAKPLAIVGILSFDELALNDQFDDVTVAERERVRKLVEGRIDELLVDLAARYPNLDRADKLRADPIIRHLLSNWPPGVGNYATRARHQAKLFRMFAELPVFAGARKRWSAAELAEARDRGRVKTIAYRDEMKLPDGPVVVLDAEDVEPTLVALFGPVQDLQAEFARERDLAARKAAAPPLPSEPPTGALATVAIASEQLRGHLWIARREVGVLFGRDGRAAERRTVSVLCPVAGAIVGEKLSIADDWNRVVLTRSQERMLERSAVTLWSSLVEQFANQAEPVAGQQRWASTRDAVHELFLRLHAELGVARIRGGKKKQAKHGNQLEQLYERLRTVPLLELGNGRWISAEVAERERPIELASLELWTGPSAEELAHARAVERREAERLRKAQAAEHEQAEAGRRRAEAARGRAEADAREREAIRRREARREAEAESQRPKPTPNKPKTPDKPSSNKPSTSKKPSTKPTPAQLLVEAIREELRLVRASNHGLLSNRLLETLGPGPAVARGPLFRQVADRIEIDVGHPLFLAALARYLEDPTLVTLLASAAYSFLNIVHVEIADAHEAEFLHLHAAYVGTTRSG